MYIYVCYVQVLTEDLDLLRTGVIGCCELSDVSAGN